MTYLRKSLVVLAMVAVCLLCTSVEAQTIKIFFVAPTADMVSNFGAANIFGGIANGYRGIEITAANLATFQGMAPPNMLRTFTELQAGTTLRTAVDQVAQISGGKVDLFILLVDDRTGLTASGIFATATIGGKMVVWPAASVSSNNCSSNDFCGVIRLGEEACIQIQNRPGVWLAWESTVVHESLHTQFVGESTKWGSIHITYGGDSSHWISELLGDQALPFEEGLGTYYGAVQNPAGRTAIIDFFTRTDERYALESRSVLAGTAEIWNAPHTEVERPIPPTARQTGRYVIRRYKWHDVPGRYLLNSESTSTAFHVLFREYVNGNHDQAHSFILSESSAMWQTRMKRFLTYGANRLALSLEDHAATAEGQAARSAGTLTSSMFPYALLDILTHFGMSEAQYRADHDRHYPDRNPQAYTEYWNHRQAVQTLVEADLNADPIRITEAVEAAHQYFREPSRILATP
jgi:hypothetical protein